MHLVFSKADAKNPEVLWDVDVAGERITGTITRGGAASAQVAGVRAPKLDRKAPRNGPPPNHCSTARTSAVGSR